MTPVLKYFYPDGVHPFEPTNVLTYTIGPANGSNILSSGIDLVVNGVDVTSTAGFSLTPSGDSWIANYSIKSNAVYSAILNVTNTAGLSSSFTNNFDTFNVNYYQWEAVDYDYTANGVSGLFIDNPVPTCDVNVPQTGHLATNSYYAYPADLPGVSVALQGTDINFPDTQPTTSDYYRADGVGSQPATDYLRPKFVAEQTYYGDNNIGPFNIGYFNGGNWLNYTRTYPTNTYNVWGRLAGGSGSFSGTTLSLVTNGYGTPDQATSVLGTFSDPSAAGWQAYHWIPLLDSNANKVVVSLGGVATLRLTSGGNLNAEFFMLVPAPPAFAVTPTVAGGQITLSFLAASGHTYTVLFTSSLTPANWAPVGNVITGNGAVTNVPETLTGAQGYYTVGGTVKDKRRPGAAARSPGQENESNNWYCNSRLRLPSREAEPAAAHGIGAGQTPRSRRVHPHRIARRHRHHRHPRGHVAARLDPGQTASPGHPVHEQPQATDPRLAHVQRRQSGFLRQERRRG